MEQVEQVFFNVPLSKLEPIFKRWIKEAQAEFQPTRFEPTDQPEQLLTIQEASEFLSLAVPTIYSKVSKGELPVMKRSKRLYFSRTELLDYLKAGRKKSNAEIEQEAKAYLKNDLLPDVRQQRELLKAFCSMLLNTGDLTQQISDDDINSFIKAFNCA